MKELKTKVYLTELFFVNRSYTRHYDFLIDIPFEITEVTSTDYLIETPAGYQLRVGHREVREPKEADTSLSLTAEEVDQVLKIFGFENTLPARQLVQYVYSLKRIKIA